jgi:predicted dehydrogenase
LGSRGWFQPDAEEVYVPTTWRAAVIGCGAIAEHLHLPGYAKCRGVTLAAVCDPVPARLEEARAFNPEVHTYRDHREMFEAEELDVVSVSSPNRYHAEQAIAALDAGAHVFLEKPAATSMKEIAEIKKAIKRSKRQLIVGYTHRFLRGNRKIQELLKEGAIGEPYMIRVRLAHMGPIPGWAKADWFYRRKEACGGATLDMGIHAIDQAIWHLGPVKSVQAYSLTLRKKIEVDDVAVMALEFASGRALGYIEVGWTSPAGFQGMEIMGDEGCITEDYAGVLTLTTGRITPDTKAKLNMKTRIIDRQPNTGGWPVEITEAVSAFRKGENMNSGIDAGGAALAVALAAYESSKTGKRVNVASVK